MTKQPEVHRACIVVIPSRWVRRCLTTPCSIPAMKPRLGPQAGDRVRVRSVARSYPLKDGLKENDVVLLKEWNGAYYLAEFEGREVAIQGIQIVQPLQTTRGEFFCPDCQQRLWMRGELWICSSRTCAFRCYVAKTALVIE